MAQQVASRIVCELFVADLIPVVGPWARNLTLPDHCIALLRTGAPFALLGAGGPFALLGVGGLSALLGADGPSKSHHLRHRVGCSLESFCACYLLTESNIIGQLE